MHKLSEPLLKLISALQLSLLHSVTLDRIQEALRQVEVLSQDPQLQQGLSVDLKAVAYGEWLRMALHRVIDTSGGHDVRLVQAAVDDARQLKNARASVAVAMEAWEPARHAWQQLAALLQEPWLLTLLSGPMDTAASEQTAVLGWMDSSLVTQVLKAADSGSKEGLSLSPLPFFTPDTIRDAIRQVAYYILCRKSHVLVRAALINLLRMCIPPGRFLHPHIMLNLLLVRLADDDLLLEATAVASTVCRPHKVPLWFHTQVAMAHALNRAGRIQVPKRQVCFC